jgi:hypothetical protein
MALIPNPVVELTAKDIAEIIKKWAATQAQQIGAGVVISDTPPLNPIMYMLWLDVAN